MKIKKDDIVKVISGAYKGKTAKVLRVHPSQQAVTLEGLGIIKRHVKPTQLNPQGGTKEVHNTIAVSKVALVNPNDSNKTTRIGYTVKKDGTKARITKQASNKEIK